LEPPLRLRHSLAGTWQTEVFYPGTQLFTGLGLSAWNFSGLLHLVYFFRRNLPFPKELQGSALLAFFAGAIALLNGCAYNHLGSNSSMDTMAWIPWVFVAVHGKLEHNLGPGSN